MNKINIRLEPANRRRNRRWRGALLVLLLAAVLCGIYAMLRASESENVAGKATTTEQMAAVVDNSTTKTSSTSEPPAAEGANTDAEQSADTKSEASTGEYTVRIVKGTYQLYLLQDGQIVHSYPIAIGENAGQKERRGDNRTPTGEFPVDEILDASYWIHDFGDGKGEIEGAYGPFFISLDTYNLSGGEWDGIGIHGTHDPDSIGTRASEGCIRMHNSDLLELKQYIGVGTKVVIEE